MNDKIKLSKLQSFILSLGSITMLVINGSGMVDNYFKDYLTRNLIAYILFFATIYISTKKIHIYKRNIVISCFLFVCIYAIIVGIPSVFIACIGCILIPAIIAGNADVYSSSNKNIKRNIVTLLFIINIIVTYFEYHFHINCFYSDLSEFVRFRASGIWGHPLYTAFITGSFMLFLLLSNFNKYIKVFFWFIGLYALLMYDARSSTIAVVLCSLLLLLKRGFLTKKNLIYVCIIFIVAYWILINISNTDIGGKLFGHSGNNTAFDERSIEYRMVALDILFNMDFTSLMEGIREQTSYISKFGVTYVENGFVVRVLNFGLPITLIFFFIEFSCIWEIIKTESKQIKYIIIAYFVIATITNQSMMESYTWNSYMIFYLFIKDFNNIYDRRTIEQQ